MAAERIPSHLVPSLFPNVYTRCPVGSVPHRETHQRCHEPASSSTVRKEGHECVRTLVTRVPGVPSTFPLVLARVQVIADSDILCDEIGGGSNRDPESPRIARPTTLNYESWSVMDKLAYTTTTNLRLRLAGMLMDMWIFFLFVAIAGECETILFLISRFARVTLRYVSIRFDSTQFSDTWDRVRDPRLPCVCVCVCVPDRVSIRRVARSVTWSACCHSTCQYALRMHNRHVRHAE